MEQFDLFAGRGKPKPIIKSEALQALYVYTDGRVHPDADPRCAALLRRVRYIIRDGEGCRITAKGRAYLRRICKPDPKRNLTDAMLKGYV